MENASKALIIAGAILISILLIAISMYVYTSAQGTVTQAGAQMSAQEKDMYNAKINSYVGSSKAGIDVKNLIDAVISNNNANMEDTGKFIAIDLDGEVVGTPGDPNNNANTVNGASTAMQNLKSKINTGKRYNVTTLSSDTGLIIKVTINVQS